MPKNLYPGTREADDQRRVNSAPVEADAPDFIAGAPNYDKFAGWPVEDVLVWLNID